jgi:nucleotide-binding universal stress UspA family protein
MTIVVGFIPTPEGHAALDRAIVEAKLRKSRLIVINVSRGDALVDSRYASSEAWSAVQEQLSRSGLDYEVAQSVAARDAADQLLDVARETNAELIVIGLRRRSPVGKLIMGSSAQRVLLDAEAPVLGVKAPPG